VGFDNAIIATGSVPAALPGFVFDGARVLGSTEGPPTILAGFVAGDPGL
jgi:pyruvate/2-oxoglutarate dehydrogenase complex dihydrolipoamide dehydrogenase (E3) component